MYTFIALKPDAALHALIQGYKDRACRRVGDQLYLSDPPHLTVYLAAFPPEFRPLAALRLPPAPRVRLAGWHAFEADALTGKNTLVAQIHADDKAALRTFQRELVAALAPHRDAAKTEARFAGRLHALTPEQRTNVRDFGFPFLFDGWQPHFTIASFDPAAWASVLAEFAADTPEGTYLCSALAEYQLDGNRPIFRSEMKMN